LPHAEHRTDTEGMALDAELRAELLHRVERDQAARQGIAGGAEATAAAFKAMAEVDGENLPWLKQVVADTGWPGESIVGRDGAHAAWLLVQHADSDPAFQRRCLDLLTTATERGDATKSQVAYLTDRVLLHEGQPQEFGTQTIARQGQWAPRRLRNPDGVDERRAAMSLGPLADYLAVIAKHYGPPSPAVSSCQECGGPVEFWPPEPGVQLTVDCPNCGHAIEVTMLP
jgi:hypothetical protein